MLGSLVAAARTAAPHELGALVLSHAQAAGLRDARLYLADLQQVLLIPLPCGTGSEDADGDVGNLAIDSTLAGRAFQHGEVLDQELPTNGIPIADDAADGSVRRLWVPVLSGSERLGILAVTLTAEQVADDTMGALIHELASVCADLVVSQQQYGDTIVALRRTRDMDVAAEMQWGLLPPLTFRGSRVAITGALEPAYKIAGDSLDYAVEADTTHLAVFDAMGHGMESALMVSVAVNAYRKVRRAGGDLVSTIAQVETSLSAVFGNERFVTGIFAELDPDLGGFRWVNAGHHPPLLMRAGKFVKALDSPSRWPLGLGIGDGTVIVASEQLEPGDRLLLFTDGVVEARSPDGEFFGVDRLVDTVLRQLAGGLSGPETMRRVVRALLEHQQERLQDDASLLLVEWRPDPV